MGSLRSWWRLWTIGMLAVLGVSSAVATTFTADLKTLTGGAADAYVYLELKNCGGFVTATGTNVRVPLTVTLPADGAGHISANVVDSSTISCATSTGVTYYHISICLRKTVCPRDALVSADYDITGSTFDLNSALPKPGLPPPSAINTPKMVFSIELENPSPADNGQWHYEFARASRLWQISCDIPADTAGTVSINFEARPDPATTGPQVLPTALDCTPTGGIATVFSQSVIAGSADSPHPLALNVATSGTPRLVRVHVTYQPQ